MKKGYLSVPQGEDPWGAYIKWLFRHDPDRITDEQKKHPMYIYLVGLHERMEEDYRKYVRRKGRKSIIVRICQWIKKGELKK